MVAGSFHAYLSPALSGWNKRKLINLGWLIIGLIGGLIIGWRLRRPVPQSAPMSTALATDPNQASPTQDNIQSQQALQLAYQMASEMSRLKGGFLARTSHELRSPMSGLIGMQQLILADLCDSPEEERDFVKQANEAALRMVKVLDDVINVAKVEHGTSELALQSVQLNMVLLNLYTATHLQAQNRNLQLHIPAVNEALYVAVDPRRLQQALIHLVDGAIANLEDGSITVLLGAVDSASVQLWIDQPLPASVWHQPLDFLPPAIAPLESVLENTLEKAAIVQRVNTPFPSLSFVRVLAQKLLVSMGGSLEILSQQDSVLQNQTRIQCTIPRMIA
ncbi:MAG: sensor histidine kinase [Leptolyngbya sp.]|nr:MAG: sensor histidine kinase [Leptolyngbya sp.]